MELIFKNADKGICCVSAGRADHLTERKDTHTSVTKVETL